MWAPVTWDPGDAHRVPVKMEPELFQMERLRHRGAQKSKHSQRVKTQVRGGTGVSNTGVSPTWPCTSFAPRRRHHKCALPTHGSVA